VRAKLSTRSHELNSVKFAVNCFVVNKGEYWGESMDFIWALRNTCRPCAPNHYWGNYWALFDHRDAPTCATAGSGLQFQDEISADGPLLMNDVDRRGYNSFIR
jgi:hypothetical protein